jgi:hypothetical protein
VRGESLQPNRALRLAFGLAIAVSVMVFNGTIILTLHGLGLDLSDPLPPTMWALIAALMASFYHQITETDFPAIVRTSKFLRWETRMLYSSAYLGAAVLFGVFNGLGPYRNSIVEASLVIPSFLAIFFFIRLCMAERQTPSNLQNP